jgi:hypothetical protein
LNGPGQRSDRLIDEWLYVLRIKDHPPFRTRSLRTDRESLFTELQKTLEPFSVEFYVILGDVHDVEFDVPFLPMVAEGVSA